MKKFFYILSSTLICVMISISSYSQVSVSPGSSTYTTLKDAVDAVNAGTHTGAVLITLTGNTTETASVVLNASGTGSASYTSISITPTGGALRSISGSIAGYLIDLSGADNVTIDGLNSGGNALTITNTSIAAASSTIRMFNDATGNTLTNLTLEGSATGAGALGVVTFASGVTTGNDNNTVSNSLIKPAGTNLPANGIYSLGTSAAINNSGNTINNVNIADVFDAANPFSGIQVNTGNSGWTITNNKIYQSATRTTSASNTHFGIRVLAGTGYVINNNRIGYATPISGIYRINGNFANRFIAINSNFDLNSGSNSIQNNEVAEFDLVSTSGANATNGVFCGINLTAGNATINGNTIGAVTGVNGIKLTSSSAVGTIMGIHVGSTNTVTVNNNNFGALTATSVGVVATAIYCINVSANVANLTITGNTIGNSVADNIIAGQATTTGGPLVAGMFFAINPTTVVISNNTIRNLTSLSNGASNAGFCQGIRFASGAVAGQAMTINANTISNLKASTSFVSYGNGILGVTGIALASGTFQVYDNTISNLSNAFAGTAGVTVTGIGVGNGTGNIYRNKIFNLSNASNSSSLTAPAIANGITVRSASGTLSIYNNMISLGYGQTTNTSFGGIMVNNGASPNPLSCRIYHNTITIDGQSAAGAIQPSFGIARTDFTAVAKVTPVDIRHNIVRNMRTSLGTAKSYAIANNYGATATNVGWPANASNTNLLIADASTIGYWNADLSFNGWRNTAVSDFSSITNYTVTFTNDAGGDLTLNMGTIPTPIESFDPVIPTFTTDYQGDARPGPVGSVNGGAFASDLGADEFDGVNLDVLGPGITYTPLTYWCDFGSRTLTATIVDAGSVPTSGTGLPTLYWRINAGAWTASTGVHVSGAQYNFTFGSGVALGDVVQYYIAAQDNVGNVSTFPLIGSSGFTTNPPAASTPPVTPSSYTIAAVLSGVYTVGTGGTYATLTAAVTDYNNKCVSGDVTFELLDPSYSASETFPITTNINPTANATNKLTIKPAAGVTSVITGAAAGDGLINIEGHYVTIDGSNSGGTTRDLTITNSNTAFNTTISVGSYGTVPITNVTIKNSILTNGSQLGYGVLVVDAPTFGPGYFNNVSITNNDFRNVNSAVFAQSQLNGGSNLTVKDNKMDNIAPNAVRRYGVYAEQVNGATIENNLIGNFESTTAESKRGIWLATGSINGLVKNNTISNIALATASTTSSVNGVYISPGAAAQSISVMGNTITNLSTLGTAASNAGIISFSPNTSITNNTITGFTVNGTVATPLWGIVSASNSNAAISGNTVAAMNNTTTSYVSGINLQGAASNMLAENNLVSNIKNTNIAPTNNAVGIDISSSFVGNANIRVDNNIAYDITGRGLPASSGFGIFLSSGEGIKVYNNTVNLNVDEVGTTGISSAMIISGATVAGALDIRNNVLVNTQTTGAQRYAIYSLSPATVFGNMDYNNYGSTGPNLGFLTTNRATLSDIQSSFGANVNSVSTLPTFVSPSDMHIVPTALANAPLNNTGIPVMGVTLDYDGNARNATKPDMGADEFTGTISTLDLTAFIEGYMNGSNMRPALLNSGISGATSAQCDTVKIELRDATSPYGVAHSFTGVIGINGKILCQFPQSAIMGNYYIAIQHRNALETWSATPQLMTGLTRYNFSTALTQAFGSNMVQVGSLYTLYSGDMDSPVGDGNVDLVDYSAWEADYNNFSSGYFRTDLNGDGNVDLIDYSIWETGYNSFISVFKP